MRHDMITEAAAALLRDSGTPCTVEDHWRDRDRPDIEAFFSPGAHVPHGHTFVDTHVVCPSDTSYVSRAQTPLGCGRAGQEVKVNRYRHLTRNADGLEVATSLPLVFESYGGAAPLTIRLLGQIVNAFARLHNPSMSPERFSAMLRQRLSVTLQRGNALVARLGLLHASGIRRTSPRGRPTRAWMTGRSA
jgi:hypothetical protein